MRTSDRLDPHWMIYTGQVRFLFEDVGISGQTFTLPIDTIMADINNSSTYTWVASGICG